MTTPDINFDLLTSLSFKDHPLANILTERLDLPLGVGEALMEARVSHHLLDMVDIPQGTGYRGVLDARTYLAMVEINQLRERLGRIAAWHARETAVGGLVGDFCIECETRWPCDTWRMAVGSHEDITDPAIARSSEHGTSDHPAA